MTDDRDRLKTTFGEAAELYQQARPEYPVELIDALVEATGVTPEDHLLEVGCATGKATLPLARRGFQVTALELSRSLADEAARNLGSFPQVQVFCSPFETWQPPMGMCFDLVVAATAWHWIDPEVRYQRAWDLLRQDGHLAFWGAMHVLPRGGDPFFAELQSVYDEIGEGVPAGTPDPRPGELPDASGEINGTGLFEVVLIRQFDWEIGYDADAYLRLLDTFSGHIAMDAGKRQHLYGEIRRRLSLRPDGLLRRHWGAVLHVARRKHDQV